MKKSTYRQNGGDDTAGQRNIKAVFDLRPEDDTYDEHYDGGRNYDIGYRGRNIKNGPIDLWNINGEIENNCSRPVTGTISEPQERKRCTHILSSVSRRPSRLGGDYGLLKSFAKPTEVQTGNSRSKRIDDDYLINVLKQLIDKLNRDKSTQSTRHRSLSVTRKSNNVGPVDDNKPTDGTSMTMDSTSREDGRIFKLEKPKGNRSIIDKPNSSSEKTFANGKRLRNEIIENRQRNYGGDCESAVINDTRHLKKNQWPTEANDDDDVGNKSKMVSINNSVVGGSAENNDDVIISTSPTLPASEAEHVWGVSRDSGKPLYHLSSDGNRKRYFKTTRDFTDDDDGDKEGVVSDGEDRSYTPSDPIVDDLQSTSDLNSVLDVVNRPDRILNENDDNPPETDYTDGPPATEHERNNSFENNNNYNYKKKPVENILSSTMIKNITEMKNVTYAVPLSATNKPKGHKRLDKSETASDDGEIDNEYENPVGQDDNIATKNKNDYSDNRARGIIHRKRVLTEFPTEGGIVAELKSIRLRLEDQIKRNNEIVRNRLDETKIKSNKKSSVLNDNLPRRAARRQKIASDGLTKPFDNPGIADIRGAGNTLGEKPFAVNGKDSTTLKRPNKTIIVGGGTDSPRNTPETTLPRENGEIGDSDSGIPDVPATKRTVSFKGTAMTRALNADIKKTLSQPPRKMPAGTYFFDDNNVTEESFSNTGHATSEENGNTEKHRKIQKDRKTSNYNYNNRDTTANPTGLNGNGAKQSKMIVTEMKTATAGCGRPIGITPTLKSKKESAPLFFDAKIPAAIAEYDNSDKPAEAAAYWPLKTLKAPSSEPFVVRKTGPKSRLKSDGSLSLKSPETDAYRTDIDDPHYDREHAPYNGRDFNPIVFDEPTVAAAATKPKLSNTNSRIRFDFQRPSSSSSSSRSRLPFRNSPRQSAPIVRPAGNYNSTPPIIDGDGNTVSDRDKYYDNGNKSKPLVDTLLSDRSRLDVLRGVKVADGVFKIPLVGHTTVDANGTARVAGVFIPIEQHDGRHTAVSLADLLTGDFQLPGGGQDADNANSTLQAKHSIPGVTADKSFRPGTVDNILRQASGEAGKTPVQIIQIINNGVCTDRCHNATGDKTNPRTSERNPNVSAVNARNDGKRRVLSSSNLLRQTRRKIQNAYNHFDSEILDRFLQVYTPIKKV